MEKSNKILVLSSIILAAFVIAAIFHYILVYYFEPPIFLKNNFTLALIDGIVDFKKVIPTIMASNPTPIGLYLLSPFAAFKNPILAYFSLVFLFAGCFIYLNIRNLKTKNILPSQNFRNIFIFCFLSYPFLMLINKGHFDMLLFLFFAGFIELFALKKYLYSCVILSIINAISPFSFIFSSLFLIEKRYKEFLYNIILAILVMKIGFTSLNITFPQNLPYFVNYTLGHLMALLKSGSFINDASSLMTLVSFVFLKIPKIFSVSFLAGFYNIFCLVVSAISLVLVWKERLYWKKITVLTTLMLLFPYFTCDYGFIYFFVPVWLFVNSEEKSKFDLVYSILFSLILIPKPFIVFLNPIIMLLLLALILFDRHEKTKEQIDG